MPIKIVKKAATTPAAVNLSTANDEFNPMLAAEGVLGSIKYPKLALPKHNGVRGGNQRGALKARSLKPIPNKHTRELFSGSMFSGLEGELVVGDPFDEEVFSISTSGVMTQVGTPAVVWYLFDWYHPTMPFHERIDVVHRFAASVNRPDVQAIEFRWINSDEELVAYAEEVLALGFEGLVLRDPYAQYKQGRSTAKEQGFMRFCPWHRSEAVILRVHEGRINQNESKVNELGFLKKSSHKDNMVGSGRAGSFDLKDVTTGIEFSTIVPTVKLQDEVWANPSAFIGKLAKYKFKPPVIKGGKPRFPQFEGIRSEIDL